MALNDASNLVGIGDLINTDYVDENVDLDKLEKLLTDGEDVEAIGEDSSSDDDPLAEYMDDEEKSDEEEVEEDDNSDSDSEDADSDDVSADKLESGMSSFGNGSSPSKAVEKFDFDDDSIVMIEEIDELLDELEEGYPTIRKKFEHINVDSEKQTIVNALKYLRRRYDRVRANTLGKEMILSAAQLLEFLFDGKRRYGPFCPDLTNWSNTIRPKVRRLQYETATVITDIMNDYKLGPWFKLGIELVPSAILYSRARKEQYGQKGYTPHQMSEAYDDLAGYD